MATALKFVLLLACARLCVKIAAAPQTALQSRAQEHTLAPTPNAKNPYLELRNKALQRKREMIGLAAPSKPTEPWSAIMDWGVGTGTATIVALSDGTASIYLSSGGGSIGGGLSHEAIRKAAKKMVSAGVELQPQMRATDTYPLPQRGQVTFYVLTDVGVFTASVLQEELNSHRHLLSKLGDAAQDIITQYRLIQNPNKSE